MKLTYEEIIEIMDANAGYLSMDTPENLYKFLTNLPVWQIGTIAEFCYNDLKYPIVDKLEKIPTFIFHEWTTSFNTWTAGSHVTQIDKMAFRGCKFDTIDLSKTKITELCDLAFNFTEAKSLKLPEGLKKIGKETFCASEFEEIHIPSTVESIGKDSFMNCTKLQKVHLCRNSLAQNKLTMDADDLERIRNKVVLY